MKIIDLGLACAAPLGFEWYGTKGYQAPEVQTILPRATRILVTGDAGRAADVWAMGVTSLAMAGGGKSVVAYRQGESKDAMRARQERALLELSRDAGRGECARCRRSWPRDLVAPLGGCIAEGSKMWGTIALMLGFECGERITALAAYEKLTQ